MDPNPRIITRLECYTQLAICVLSSTVLTFIKKYGNKWNSAKQFWLLYLNALVNHISLYNNLVISSFWGSDLYIFDEDEERAVVSYDEVCQAYTRLFDRLELPHVKGKVFFGEWNPFLCSITISFGLKNNVSHFVFIKQFWRNCGLL